MSYLERINVALEQVPGHIRLPVLTDIHNRITDWMSSGGDANAPYIEQQVRYAENIAKYYKGE